jgi:hypothetical protein
MCDMSLKALKPVALINGTYEAIDFSAELIKSQ